MFAKPQMSHSHKQGRWFKVVPVGVIVLLWNFKQLNFTSLHHKFHFTFQSLSHYNTQPAVSPVATATLVQEQRE